MAIEIKVVTDAGYDEFSDAVDVAFTHLDQRGQGAFRRRLFGGELAAGRMIGAYDGGRLVGTFGNHRAVVTVPGRAALPVAGVTAVSVAQTHRRRGILSS